MAVILASCDTDKSSSTDGTSTQDSMTINSFKGQPILSNAEYLAGAPYVSADPQYGERIAMQCRACHTLDAGGPTLLGPNLNGLFGRRSAAQSNFDYSPALANADFIWTPAVLDAWLAEPSRFLPGNRMAFAGIRDQRDRDALIAYLLVQTDSGRVAGDGSK